MVMSQASLRLPKTAPFAPEHIAALDAVIAKANPGQRAWLAGFLAGLDAAQPAGQAAALPAAVTERPRLLILYATESGNAEALASKARGDATRRGFAARVADMAEFRPENLGDAKNLLVIASTWGDGEPPQRAAPFYRAMMGASAPRLDGLRFSVLALGDSAYAQFCETGKRFDARLAELGATRAAPLVMADLDYATPARRWLEGALDALLPPEADGGSVIHVDFARPPGVIASRTAPASVTISAHHPLTSSRADSTTVHIELDLAGADLAYEPGDAIGVLPRNDPALVTEISRAAGLGADAADALSRQYDITTLTEHQLAEFAELGGIAALASPAARAEYRHGRQWLDLLQQFPGVVGGEALLSRLRPLQPRYYSVASSRRLVGDEAHLTIARVAYASAGRGRTGVASGFLADRLSVGAEVDVFVRPNPHFRLPEDGATPIIMVGAGTGIAPYRGFLQDREATGAAGRTWLVFGHRRFLHDFLYQLEIQAWLAAGVLSRLDLATSRDAPEKRYVQHVLRDQKRELRAWLDQGATLYLCGDATHMARDVDATLTEILGETGLDELIGAGRYKKDVY